MGVTPGFGQPFITSVLDKLRAARRQVAAMDRAPYRDRRRGEPAERGEIRAAGADVLVAGSAIFSQPDYSASLRHARGWHDAPTLTQPSFSQAEPSALIAGARDLERVTPDNRG